MNLFRSKINKSRREVAVGLPPILARLWRFAYSLTRNADAADDLMQETCARALGKSDQFKCGTRLDAWVFTICRSIFLNNIRAGNVRRGAGLVPVEETDLADLSPSVESNIFATQVVEHVMALPDTQRETVFLVYVEGFSYREASDILEIPIGTIMSRLSTARQRLAHLGNDRNDDEFDGKKKGG